MWTEMCANVAQHVAIHTAIQVVSFLLVLLLMQIMCPRKASGLLFSSKLLNNIYEITAQSHDHNQVYFHLKSKFSDSY